MVIDEAQRHFRPRAAGSVVPDHVAALEVHRHQGLDIWLVTQRPGLVDANVRALCGKHIALRQTPLGRYKYEWPEVGDIESKTSRDNAARTRYKLPRHVFGLYKSAEAHVKHRIALPMSAKVLMVALPAAAFFLWQSYVMISAKFHPKPVPVVAQVEPSHPIKNASVVVEPVPVDSGLPVGLEPYDAKGIAHKHPFENAVFRITGRIKSASKEIYSFAVSAGGGSPVFMSSADLLAAGYSVVPVNDCSAKLVYKSAEFFVSCIDSAANPAPSQPLPAMGIS